MLVSGRPTVAEFADPPDHLPTDAKSFWRDIVTQLTDVGLVDRVDGPALEMFATAYARVCPSRRVLSVDTHYALGSRGQNRRASGPAHRARGVGTFTKLAEHFWLTPVARARLGLAELHRRVLSVKMATNLGRSTCLRSGTRPETYSAIHTSSGVAESA
ncbi:MAG: P27 family phage terminase small subunit [Solirubrobacteraceae bacterium]|nr:P27 family phage terminase small subunit [Solirubrobacteraceae bacterium]